MSLITIYISAYILIALSGFMIGIHGSGAWHGDEKSERLLPLWVIVFALDLVLFTLLHLLRAQITPP